MSGNERVPELGELYGILDAGRGQKEATIQQAQQDYLGGLAMALQTGNVEQIGYYESALSDLYDARPDLRPEADQD
jgi:hypothetical protein